MISDHHIGKLPPQAIELEKAVLGALMLEKHTVFEVMDKLSPEVFYKEPHQLIFTALQQLYADSKPTDFLTVLDQLKKMGKQESVGGPYYITQLVEMVGTTDSVNHHSHVLLEKHFQREVIRIASEAVGSAYSDEMDVFDLIDRIQADIAAMTNLNMPTTEFGTKALFNELHTHMAQARANREQGIRSGVPTELDDLDVITNGWQPGHLIIVAARPGMGKSAFTKKCIQGCVQQTGKPVHVFSLEMTRKEWIARILSEEVKQPSDKFLSGDHDILAEQKVMDLADEYYDNKRNELLFIDDTPAISIDQLRSRAKRLFYGKEDKPGLIVVDYLQLMTKKNVNSRGNREQEISEISRGLKSLAKELNVPIIALSQLNREVEARGGDMKPKLSDLRESGAIEQDADIVMFIYRPYYYFQQGHAKFATVMINEREVDSKHKALLIIAKNRHGATGKIYVKFIDYLTKFVNIDSEDDLPF